jgi:hypothetical protein
VTEASDLRLTPEQRAFRDAVRAFVDSSVMPAAPRWDREQAIGVEVVEELRARGYFGVDIPAASGGLGLDAEALGLFAEELGRGCSSLRSLLTVHGMVAHAVGRWGSKELRARLLPELAAGRALGALAFTEAEAGSDLQRVEAQARSDGGGFVLSGKKRWITFGQLATIFLVLARAPGGLVALLVPRDLAGVNTKPIRDILGLRASMLAEIEFQDCIVPRENLVGREGFGLSHVGSAALDHGRFTVACGCVGMAQASLEASVRYAGGRTQFGVKIRDHQLVRRMITEMATDTRAARLLCRHAGALRAARHPSAIAETSIAKYFASRAAMRIAADAVQIHGANGVVGDFPVERHFRDAKIMEIIEGSSEMHQIHIAETAFQEVQ